MNVVTDDWRVDWDYILADDDYHEKNYDQSGVVIEMLSY